MDNPIGRGRRAYRLELAATTMGKERADERRPMVEGVKRARKDQEHTRPVMPRKQRITVLSPGPLHVQGIANGVPVTWNSEAGCWLDDKGIGYDMVLA